MPKFTVDIRIYIGGYEKCTSHIVKAEDSDVACYEALCDETHNEPLTWKQYLNGEEWEDDIFVYRIDNVVQIEE